MAARSMREERLSLSVLSPRPGARVSRKRALATTSPRRLVRLTLFLFHCASGSIRVFLPNEYPILHQDHRSGNTAGCLLFVSVWALCRVLTIYNKI